MAPWKLEEDIVAKEFVCRAKGGVRASLVAADPLMVEMGRPNREQVVTTRAETATTLQALELTNGKTLADRPARGERINWFERRQMDRNWFATFFRKQSGESRRSMRLRWRRNGSGTNRRGTAWRIFYGPWRCCRNFN